MKLALSIVIMVVGTIGGLSLEASIYQEMFYALGILGVFCVFASLNGSPSDETSTES